MSARHRISLILLCLAAYVADSTTADRVRLRDTQLLTLQKGAWTTGRRTSPMPQLKCTGGSNKCDFLPATVECYNRGTDGKDVQWECSAILDKNLRFGKMQVTCEGYDHPDDEYVLSGSCGLEYTIDGIDVNSLPMLLTILNNIELCVGPVATVFIIIGFMSLLSFLSYYMYAAVMGYIGKPIPSEPGFRPEFTSSAKTSTPPAPSTCTRRNRTTDSFVCGSHVATGFAGTSCR